MLRRRCPRSAGDTGKSSLQICRWLPIHARMGGHRQSVRAFARQQAPFAGAAALGWIAMLVGSSLHWGQYALSVALLAIALAIPFAGAAGGRLTRTPVVVG